MPSTKTPPQVLLAFDFGLKRIGVAIGQRITKTAKPLPLLKAIDGVPKWNEIEKIIKTWRVEGLIVGIPYNMDGTEQPMTQLAHAFAKKLQGRFALPIYFVDERLTTHEAKRHIRNLQKKEADVDSIAAAIILESWFANE